MVQCNIRGSDPVPDQLCRATFRALQVAGEEALTDWRIVLAPPLVLVNQLPMPATFLVWELPKVRTDKLTCFPITLMNPEAITINNLKTSLQRELAVNAPKRHRVMLQCSLEP